MKRDLFVFAGQSNMMGAAVYTPKIDITLKNSFEYKHKPRRLGKASGEFTQKVYPVGEFSYDDIGKAYGDGMVDGDGKSTLTNYSENTFFCPAMTNLDSDEEKTVLPFNTFSESTARHGATLAPFLAEEWEILGGASAYAHIAKGGVGISYYFTEEMIAEYTRRIEKYNRENGVTAEPLGLHIRTDAAEYFFEKCRDFFEDAKAAFSDDDTSNKCFFWLQGEGDARRPAAEYEIMMDVLWEELQRAGFTHFFCIRVDYWGHPDIYQTMKAQESFCANNKNAYMLTRVASYFDFVGQTNEDEWFITPPTEECRNCRDSFFGFENQHINEKGFAVIAKHAAPNLYRALRENAEPILEEENIRLLREV